MFSFQRDKNRVELQAHMRRVADLTSPNLIPIKGGIRSEERFNRSLPVLVAPYENGKVSIEGGAFALSKDLCDHGVSVISCQSCPETDVVVGMWLYTPHIDKDDVEPFFFLGRVRQCAELGAGYWQIGIELKEVVKSHKLLAELKPLALKLLPQNGQPETAAL